ncbi:thyroid transcription factor 1-associated protein 26 homolog [Manduca sexta]|uniref:thyroid transcription factor 1-associated protein 26 homolog n=1 Tax=Manduca sexta TaxID=7130 RepID=UPI00188E9356|nr:thyroid transcription factor 1-associated protein 26 homolog [Manduca sexta]
MEMKNLKNKKQEKIPADMAVSKRQEQFDGNRGVTEKKPFDKKAYRLKKYSKKYKLDQWEENRKKKLLRDYYKEVKNEPKDNLTGSYKAKSFDEDTTDSNNVGKFVRHPDLIEKDEEQSKIKDVPKKDPYHKAKEHYNKVKEEKLLKKENIEKAKEERNQKLQEYKKKKQQRFKKLSKKNKKGQPMMTGRLEMLLEKIQKNGK